MGVIGLSIIVASVVLFCLRPPQWLPRLFATLRQQQQQQQQQQIAPPPPPPPPTKAPATGPENGHADDTPKNTRDEKEKEPVQEAKQTNGVPIPPAPIIQEKPLIQVTNSSSLPDAAKMEEQEQEAEEEQTTPKATATATADSVPSLVLPEPSGPTSSLPTPSLVLPSIATPTPPPSKRLDVRPPSRLPTPPRITARSTSPQQESRPAPPSSMMPPPPVPKKPRPSGIPQPATASSSSSPISSSRRLPTLDPSPNRERNLPIPRRGAPARGPAAAAAAASSSSSLGSGLAPPPTHSSIPKKPSRQVTLEPGHSPMDWARLAQSPTSDLRGLPPNTPYLRVTPSMLKQMNGRKGRDAWSVYGGKVYNVSPYIPFHPGGAGELLRGAGKDATKLFGEVHPWVNYETMLSACLIGLLVEEHETENRMEEMD